MTEPQKPSEPTDYSDGQSSFQDLTQDIRRLLYQQQQETEGERKKNAELLEISKNLQTLLNEAVSDLEQEKIRLAEAKRELGGSEQSLSDFKEASAKQIRENLQKITDHERDIEALKKAKLDNEKEIKEKTEAICRLESKAAEHLAALQSQSSEKEREQAQAQAKQQELENELRQTRLKNEALEKERAEADAKISQIKEASTKEISEARERSAEHQALAEKLADENALLKKETEKQKAAYEAELEIKKSKIIELEKTGEDLRLAVENKGREIDGAVKEKAESLASERAQAQIKHKELQDRLDALSRDYDATAAKLKEAEQKSAVDTGVIEQQKREAEEAASNLAQHRELQTQAEKKLAEQSAQSEQQLQALRAEKEDLIQKHKELEGKLDALSRDYAAATAKLKEAEEESAAAAEVIEQQKKAVAETASNLTQQRELNAQAENRRVEQLTQSERQLQALQGEKEDLVRKHKELHEKLEAATRNFLETTAKLTEAEEKNRVNLNDLENQKKEHAEAISRLAEQQNLSIEKEAAVRQLAENKRQIEVLGSEKDGLAQKQKSLEAKLVELQVREEALRQEKQKQHELLDEHIKKEQALRDKYSALEAVKNTMFTGWKDERERLAQATASLTDLQSKLVAAEEEAKKWKESAALLQTQNSKTGTENKVWTIGAEEDGLKNKNQLLSQALDSERARAKKMEEDLARLRQVIALGQPKASAPEIKSAILPVAPKPTTGKDKVNGLELILALEDKKEPPQSGKTK
ncbi:MAG TPA: hypothetical protein PLY88_02855 [Candidatus Omnitrophota bacterium]|nr:hypothetical protein [Candidatus Omnitrophota bacterium]